MARHFPLLALLTLSTPAMAEEGGTLSGSLGDAPLELSLWGAQSDFWGDAAYGGVSILATGETGTLVLGFDMTGSGVSVPEIAWRPSGDTGGFFADEDSGARITVSQAVIENGELHLTGTATGQLGYSTDMGHTFDPANNVAATIDFDVTVASED